MQGTRLLDLSQSVTGAYATRLLAATGAEVTVGEPPGGSPLRHAPPLLPSPAPDSGRGGGEVRSAAWEYLGAYKRSVILTEDEIDEAAGAFDAVVLATDGPAAPLAERAERLRRLHAGLVVAALTPYGLTGPYATRRAGPLELWAAGGHLTLNGEPDREPIPGGGPWASHLVGATAAVAIQAALIRATASPNQPGGGTDGVLLDIGAMEALVSAHQWSFSVFTHTGAVKRRAGNRLGEMHHPIALYPCQDGWVCLAAASYNQWEGLCIAMDQVELLADDTLSWAAERFDRADELDELITAWTSQHTVAEVVRVCQEHLCPAGPVTDLATIADDPQLVARCFWERAPHLGPHAVMPGVPFRSPTTPSFTPAPALSTLRPLDPPPPATPTPTSGRAAPAASHQPDRPGPTPWAPLAGVRVVELAISWAGPLAGRHLADLGAEVIKVEHPTSRGVAVTPPTADDPAADDPTAGPDDDPDDSGSEEERWRWGQMAPAPVRNGIYPDAEPGESWWNRMSYWNKMNRSKRSLCLDIKAPGGREVFERLVATADIVLNNYSPRGVRSLVVDHDTLRAIKPDVVTVAMSGFGATGPGAEAVSWGPILDAASGLASTTGYHDSGPYKQGVAFPDPVGGVHGASAVLAAWWAHERTGAAVHVDLSQLETLLSIAGDQVVETTATGCPPVRRGARSATYAPAGVYPALDRDRWLALTVYDDDDWSRLVTLIPTLDRARWADVTWRHHDHDEIDELITAWTVARPVVEAATALHEAGLAAAGAATNQDLVEDPHLAARGFPVMIDQPCCGGPRLYPGSPFLIDGRPLSIGPAPTLGADNGELLDELGFGPSDHARLVEAGAIATAPPV